MKISVVNGYQRKNKDKEYMFSTVDDIMRLKNACKELKLNLKLSVDFTDFNGRNGLKKNVNDMVNTFSSIRNFIVALHMNEINSWGRNRDIYINNQRRVYINTMDYPTLSEFIGGLSTILQDSQPRYLIPTSIHSFEKLELLIDTLYRGGCCFEVEEIKYEKE